MFLRILIQCHVPKLNGSLVIAIKLTVKYNLARLRHNKLSHIFQGLVSCKILGT